MKKKDKKLDKNILGNKHTNCLLGSRHTILFEPLKEKPSGTAIMLLVHFSCACHPDMSKHTPPFGEVLQNPRLKASWVNVFE